MQNPQSGKYGQELVIPLPNGNTLRCGQGEEYNWGGYVRVCSSHGEELMYWSAMEWEEDPEAIMGAIFGYALDIPFA